MRTVDHDGGITRLEGFLRQFETVAVVKMHDDRNRNLGGFGVDHGAVHVDGGVFQRGGRRLDDDGGFHFDGGGDDGHDHFHVFGVEGADGVMFFLCVQKEFFRGDEHCLVPLF